MTLLCVCVSVCVCARAHVQIAHDLFLEDLALANVITQEQSKEIIKRNRVVEEVVEEGKK